MNLREEIIAEMHRNELSSIKKMPSIAYGRNLGWFCTWWFPPRINRTAAECRRELKRMEREGLVTADRRQTNNTRWLLTEAPVEANQEKGNE